MSTAEIVVCVCVSYTKPTYNVYNNKTQNVSRFKSTFIYLKLLLVGFLFFQIFCFNVHNII